MKSLHDRERLTEVFSARAPAASHAPLARNGPLAPFVLALALASGCGGSGPSSTGSGPTVETSLNELGIDTTPSPRLGDNGQPLPENYSPLGKTLQIDPLMELYVGGVPLTGSTSVATLLEDFSNNPPDGTGTITPEPLFALDAAEAPWWPESLPSQSFRQTKRAVAAADLDGNGIDEIVTLFAEDPRLSLQIVRRTDTGFETSVSTILFNTPGITSVALAAGDFDGDTRRSTHTPGAPRKFELTQDTFACRFYQPRYFGH